MSDFLAEANEKTRLHQYAEAEALYKQYLEGAEDAGVREELGLVQLKQKKYYEAIEMFSEVCEACPDNAGYFANLADVLSVVHRFDDAMAMYERAAQISGSHAYQLKAAQMNACLGKYDAALVLLNLIQSAHANDPEVYACIAGVQEEKGMKLEAALTRAKELELRKALTEGSPSAESWTGYAALQGVLGNWAEAKRGYQEALKYGKTAQLLLGLGGAMARLGDDEADREFEAAAALDPLDFSMLVSIGDLLTDLEKYGSAIQMYTQALALRNVNADTWVAIAYALYKSGNTEDAQAFYEMAKASAAVREMPWADKMHKSAKTEELDKVL